MIRPSSLTLKALLFASKALVVGVFITAVGSCGLDEYVFLYPPDTAKDNNVLSLYNNTQNDPAVFLGYRFLYRFYPNIDAVNSGISNVAARYSSSPTNIYSIMKNTLGFRDLRISNDDRLIVDTVDRPEAFSIVLDFTDAIQGSGDKTVEIRLNSGSFGTVPNLPCNIYRTISGQTGIGFASDQLLGYEDFSIGENYDGSGTVYLQLYVLAYGQSIFGSNFSEIYSEPKYFIGSPSYLTLTVE